MYSLPTLFTASSNIALRTCDKPRTTFSRRYNCQRESNANNGRLMRLKSHSLKDCLLHPQLTHKVSEPSIFHLLSFINYILPPTFLFASSQMELCEQSRDAVPLITRPDLAFIINAGVSCILDPKAVAAVFWISRLECHPSAVHQFQEQQAPLASSVQYLPALARTAASPTTA